VAVYSEVGYVTPSQVPDALAAVTRAIDNDFVVIAWAATPDARGAPVTAYRILIQSSDPTASYENDWCLGDGTPHPAGDDNLVMDHLYCEVPMADLRAAPYELVQGDLVVATVAAANARGWSAASPPNEAGVTV